MWEVFRNTPLLVQIFFLTSRCPTSYSAQRFTGGWLPRSSVGGAYNVENFRAGFEAVNRGTSSLPRACFSRFAAFRQAALPLGWRIALPSVTNILISISKNSSF